MMNLVQAFKEGGFTMWLVLGSDVCFLGTAVVALAVAFAMRGSTLAKVTAAGLGAIALLPVLIGVAGYYWGMQQVMAAVAYADPAQKAMLMAYGEAEALHNLWFGAGSLVCTLPVAFVVVAASLLSQPKP